MLGFFLTFILIFFIGMSILIVVSLSKTETVVVPSNSILQVSLEEEIHDRPSSDPFNFVNLSKFEIDKKLGLNDVLKSLKKAASDDNIKGILLELGSIPSGLATIEEIRNALIKFKESGKFIISYGEVYSQKAYYMASVADEVYLNPEGFIEFKGLAGQVMFIKGLLDKFDIETTIIRGKNNKFKSAVEPLMYDKMSEANKEQTRVYVTSLWDNMLEGISNSRNISTESLNAIADGLEIKSAELAVQHKLVDDIVFKDELLDKLRDKLGLDPNKKISNITLKKYFDVPAVKKIKKRSKNKIAVIYAQGEIKSGKQDEMTISSDRLSKTIRKARLDEKIKAIVLRVNSPGGSALASEVIYREVVLAKKEKPLIVSMGNLAASGGYYIACGADKIYANPTTLTGSIGVFGIMPNFQATLKNWLGITFDGVNTNTYSDFGSAVRPMSPYEENVIRYFIEDIYDTFIAHVAEGRNMTTSQVDSIGQGRVWCGVDAKKIGLVDEFGGLELAIKEAAKMAELDEYRTVSLPVQKDFLDKLIDGLSINMSTKSLEKELGENYDYFTFIRDLSEMDKYQARLPFMIEIQ